MYNVSTKVNGKWWKFGSIRKNQYGNLQLSMKNTGQLKELILQGGEWIKLSLFDEEVKETAPPPEPKRFEITDDEIPF
jgi:hypothetical protein